MMLLPLFLHHRLNGSYNSQFIQAPTCTKDLQSSLAPPYLPGFRHQPNSLLNRSFGPIFHLTLNPLLLMFSLFISMLYSSILSTNSSFSISYQSSICLRTTNLFMTNSFLFYTRSNYSSAFPHS